MPAYKVVHQGGTKINRYKNVAEALRVAPQALAQAWRELYM